MIKYLVMALASYEAKCKEMGNVDIPLAAVAATRAEMANLLNILPKLIQL